jgi:hypothetical protein
MGVSKARTYSLVTLSRQLRDVVWTFTSPTHDAHPVNLFDKYAFLLVSDFLFVASQAPDHIPTHIHVYFNSLCT